MNLKKEIFEFTKIAQLTSSTFIFGLVIKQLIFGGSIEFLLCMSLILSVVSIINYLKLDMRYGDL